MKTNAELITLIIKLGTTGVTDMVLNKLLISDTVLGHDNKEIFHRASVVAQ